jgi:hypothetical protein
MNSSLLRNPVRCNLVHVHITTFRIFMLSSSLGLKEWNWRLRNPFFRNVIKVWILQVLVSQATLISMGLNLTISRLLFVLSLLPYIRECIFCLYLLRRALHYHKKGRRSFHCSSIVVTSLYFEHAIWIKIWRASYLDFIILIIFCEEYNRNIITHASGF